VAANWGLGLAVLAVMMELLGRRGRPQLGELRVAWLLPLVEAWIGESAIVSPLLEVLPPVTAVTDGSVMAVSVGEGARFVVV